MRESFLKLLRGEPSNQVVWTADVNYWLDGQRHAAEKSRYRNGEEGYLDLCQELGCMPYYGYDQFWLSEPEYQDVGFTTRNEGPRCRRFWKTPVGDLWEEEVFMEESLSNARTKYAVETESDLKILLHVLEHRRLKPAVVDVYRDRMKRWALYDGVPALGMPRSPLSSFLHEWAGMGHGVYLVTDHHDLVCAILNLMEEQERPILEAACRLAPPLVHFPDNLSSANLAGYFDEFMAEPYKRRLDAFHAAGVRCAVHLDGTVKGLLPKLTGVGIDAVEAITPYPVGDLKLEEMRSTAGSDEVILWGGVPGAMFTSPFTWKEMEPHLNNLVAAWKGTPFIVGVADQVPPNGDIGMVRKISEFLKAC